MEVVGYAEGEPLLTSPKWFLQTNCVVRYPSAFAVEFKCYFKQSKITVKYLNACINLNIISLKLQF